MSERRGFTLVELLLALAILATLLAVAYGGVIQFMQSRSDLDAAINAQAKLRRIVEVFTQDLRSAVFGGLSATPYPSGNASISFALIEGGAGYPVLPHDSGNNQRLMRAAEAKIVVTTEGDDTVRELRGEFKVKIPLVGSKVEKAVVGDIGTNLEEEADLVAGHLGLAD